MFPTSIRFLLATASAAFGVYQIHRGSIAGGLYVVAAALLVYGHFRYGSRVAGASNGSSWKHGPHATFARAGAQSGLADLGPAALVAADRKDDHAAEKHLRLAIDHRLRTENDRALVEVMLARILIDAARRTRPMTFSREPQPAAADPRLRG
jgi:hypothetical protein